MSRFRILPQGDKAIFSKKVDYNIPGLFRFSDLIYDYIDVVREKFGADIRISSVYGSPSIKWNGGRLQTSYKAKRYTKLEIEKEIIEAKKHNITPLLTFSNSLLNQSDLNDPLGNYILDLLTHEDGEVIVTSDMLEDYIRHRFPSLKIHSSVIKTANQQKRDYNYYSSLSNDYYRYVVHPDDIFNVELLESLPKANAEVLINERCGYKCQNRRKHYESISREQASINRGDFEYEHFLDECNMIPENKQKCAKSNNISCSSAELNSLINMGFQHIKLQGRTDNLYTFFFDLMRYTLDNDIAFPNLYPIFVYGIDDFLKEGQM